MSVLALGQWADYRERFQNIFTDTDIKFASSKAPGISGLHTKEIMWAIRILLCWFQSNNYIAISFKVEYENQSPIGFGQILSTISMSGGNGLDGNVTNGTTMASRETRNATFNSTQSLSQPLVGQVIATDHVIITDIHSGGEPFRPYLIYSVLASILISEAEFDDKDGTTAGTIGFDNDKVWSIAILATSAEAVDNLTHETVILALADLARRLPTITPVRLRWHELSFRVRRNGAIIGRGFIRKEVPPPPVTANNTVATA